MKKYLLLLVAAIISATTYAQTQRALIIGIDAYDPPANAVFASDARSEFSSLDGCRNDAIAMRDAVIARYGFKNEKGLMKELYDSVATRQAILDGMNELLTNSKKGDIAFIYYAGHGSQVKNSLSKEDDKLDESMVPADTWKEGVHDIRDRELNKIFNAFVDKGVILTVIYDCCHSTNMSRGISEQPKTRFIAGTSYDAKDPSPTTDPAGKPGDRFLMMSACMSYQLASETRDEHDMPHGAFTVAILAAMKQVSVNASARDLFNTARAILKCNGKSQEPSITATDSRQSATLFGLGKGVLSDKTVVPVMGIDKEAQTITLQAGEISGLNVENELKNADGSITLKVIKIEGADRSVAQVVAGEFDKVKGGDLFTVTNWVSPHKTFLKLYVPASTLAHKDLIALGVICDQLKKTTGIKWVYDLDKQDPTVSLFYKDGKWYANTAKGQVNVPSFTADKIAAQFPKSTLFVNIPPTKELFDEFTKDLEGQANVQLVKTAVDANYTLLGRINNEGTLEYSLFNFASLKDSLEVLPMKTDYATLNESSAAAVATELTGYAFKLGKIRIWTMLNNPSSEQGFPYVLEIRNKATNKKATRATVGEDITLHIVKDKTPGAKWDNIFRYVYVFIIDHSGRMQLIYPSAENATDMNRMPDKDDMKKEDYVLPGEFTIEPPTGTDNYYMFASVEPIINYATVFNQAGVTKDRGGTRGAGGLNDLLNMGNISTRGVKAKTPNTWSLRKVSLKSVYKMTP